MLISCVTLLIMTLAPSLKAAMSAEERYAEMSRLFKGSPVQSISSEQFHLLVEPKNKNYAVVVVFTTTHPQHVCPMCTTAVDALTKVAKAYQPNDRLRIFFAIIDFKDSQDVFLQLRLNAVPVIYFYGANRHANDVRKIYFDSDGPAVDIIAKVIQQETKQKVRVVESISHRALLTAGSCVVIIGLCLHYATTKLKLLSDTLLWSTIGLVQVTFFISGFMWNQIRNPQFSVHHAKKLIDRLVSTAQSYQYGAESIFISAIYLTIAAGLLLLDKGGRSAKGSSSWLQKGLKMFGIALFLVGLNMMMYLFVRKSPYYPYSFFR